jgi:hypothetical protein
MELKEPSTVNSGFHTLKILTVAMSSGWFVHAVCSIASDDRRGGHLRRT